MDRGDRDDAAERLARAAPLADKLGAGPLASRSDRWPGGARLGLPSGPASPSATPDGPVLSMA